MALPDLNDPNVIWSPATEQDLIDAGFDPDEWRCADGSIIGSDIPAGPLSEGDVVISTEEMHELFGSFDDDDDDDDQSADDDEWSYTD